MSSKLERRFKKKGQQLPIRLQKRVPAGTVKKFTHKKGWKRKTNKSNNNSSIVINPAPILEDMPRFKNTGARAGPIQMVPRAAAQAAVNARAAPLLAPRAVRVLPGNVVAAGRRQRARRRYKSKLHKVQTVLRGKTYTKIALNPAMRKKRRWKASRRGNYGRCLNPQFVLIPTFCRRAGGGGGRRRRG